MINTVRFFKNKLKDEKYNNLLKVTSAAYYFLSRNRIKKKGINNIISLNGAFVKNSKVNFIGSNNEIVLGRMSVLKNLSITIIGENHKLLINQGCTIKDTEFWFEDKNCTISVGSNTRINGAHIAITEPNSNISIGNDCLFSMQIDIRNGDSHSIIDLNTKRRINYAKDIRIGNHVWLGKFVKILKGSIIGDNSVIGINSMVFGEIKNNSLAVGVPARTVKENITWQIERIYDDSINS
jgi:acetyltransferase-like isoleucine patch superfamily enzyme